jgi:hypothetical protein
LTARKFLGITGGSLVLIGVFLPAASAPLTGKLCLLSISWKYGALMACIAVAAVLFSVRKVFRGLWPVVFAVPLTLGLAYYDARSRLIGKLSGDGPVWANNFAKGLQSIAMKTVHYHWGLAVIVAGAVLVLLAAALGGSSNSSESI